MLNYNCLPFLYDQVEVRDNNSNSNGAIYNKQSSNEREAACRGPVSNVLKKYTAAATPAAPQTQRCSKTTTIYSRVSEQEDVETNRQLQEKEAFTPNSTHALLLISENHKPEEEEITEKTRTLVTKTTKNTDTEKEKRHRKPHRERQRDRDREGNMQ